jgi:hypothetical protein
MRVCGLKRLALETATAFERMDAALSKELRELIDDGKPKSPFRRVDS